MRHWIWCDIDQRIPILTSALPRSILVFSGRYHIISNASLVNNCILYSFLNIKPMNNYCFYRCFQWFLDTFSYTVHIILNIHSQIENIVLYLNKKQSIHVPVYYKYSKLILRVCRCLLLWKSPLSSASLQPVESSHSTSINSCSTIFLPIHSKLMSHHHQDSNLLAIQGLAHSETDINAW